MKQRASAFILVSVFNHTAALQKTSHCNASLLLLHVFLVYVEMCVTVLQEQQSDKVSLGVKSTKHVEV